MTLAEDMARLDEIFGKTTDPRKLDIRKQLAGLGASSGPGGVLTAAAPDRIIPPAVHVPSGKDVDTDAMIARADITPSGGGAPAAAGFDIFDAMFKNLMLASADRRAAVDQTISTIRMMNELQRVSPSRAAAFSAALGLPDEENLDFVNNLDKRANVRVSGQVGRQTLSLPLALSGRSLSFLNENQNVANVVGDVADAIGMPDLFARSAGSALPTSRSLLSMAG